MAKSGSGGVGEENMASKENNEKQQRVSIGGISVMAKMKRKRHGGVMAKWRYQAKNGEEASAKLGNERKMAAINGKSVSIVAKKNGVMAA